MPLSRPRTKLKVSRRAFHRSTAVVISGIAIVHLANHLVSLHSIAAHIAFMNVARTVYRQPAIEFVLIASVIFQCGSGLWMVVRGWSARQGAVAWLQALSGSYLAVFLLIHVSAVVLGRIVLISIRTSISLPPVFMSRRSSCFSFRITCWRSLRCSRMRDLPATGRFTGARSGCVAWR